MINIYKQKRRSLWHMGLVFLLAFSTLHAQAQEVVVNGKVTDAETEQGLPGASVRVVGTTTGTVTDVDGNFSLSVSASGVVKIEISFVGYATATADVQVSNGSTAPINVALKAEYSALDEVVVTGTGVATSRKQLGNYISTIKSSDLVSGAANNPLAALQGKVAGAQIMQNNGNPAGGFTVRLRGASSIVGSSEPLYIIDGVIVNNNTNNLTDLSIGISGNNDFSPGSNRLVDINPNDIDRVEVLNGAAASALYGSRASNGVVQIFTKRGTTGKPSITFSTSVTVSELRKRIDVNKEPIRFGTGFNRFPSTPAEINDQRLTSILLFNRLFPNSTPVTRYDYQDDIFRQGIGTDNYLSIAGGNEKTKYLFSGSYYKNEGIIKGDRKSVV